MNTKFKIGDKVRRLSKYKDVDWNECHEDTRDNVFTIGSIDSGGSLYLKDDTCGFSWFSDYFELVEDVENITDNFLKARELIGEEVYYWMDGGLEKEVVLGVSLINKTLDFNIGAYSDMVREALQDTEEVIVLHITGQGNIPFSSVVEKPISKLVKLNNNYTAEVYKDKIVVGCQTFPINILDNLNDALGSL